MQCLYLGVCYLAVLSFYSAETDRRRFRQVQRSVCYCFLSPNARTYHPAFPILDSDEHLSL